MGLRVWGLGLMVFLGFGLRVWGWGLGCLVLGLGLQVGSLDSFYKTLRALEATKTFFKNLETFGYEIFFSGKLRYV